MKKLNLICLYIDARTGRQAKYLKIIQVLIYTITGRNILQLIPHDKASRFLIPNFLYHYSMSVSKTSSDSTSTL